MEVEHVHLSATLDQSLIDEFIAKRCMSQRRYEQIPYGNPPPPTTSLRPPTSQSPPHQKLYNERADRMADLNERRGL